jgi:hypothetical protein
MSFELELAESFNNFYFEQKSDEELLDEKESDD